MGMTRYYLHFYNRIGLARDEEGRELPNLDAAREAAIEAIRDVMSEEARTGRIDLRGYIEIVDDTQEVRCRVPFSSAIDLHLDEPR